MYLPGQWYLFVRWILFKVDLKAARFGRDRNVCTCMFSHLLAPLTV